MDKLKAVHEAAASQELDDDLEGQEREKVKAGMARKKMAAIKNAVRVVSSTAHGSITWDPTYKRTDVEEEAWQEMSDTYTAERK